MKRNRFRLPSRSRLAIWKSLSVTLVTLLSLPYAGFASLRGDLSLRNAGVTAIVAAPLAAMIEVNTTGDGDNLNPSIGCDSDAAAPGDQCRLRR
jgi:hypothetical protein